MQLLAKFKKILYLGFSATLNFRKQKLHLFLLSKFYNKKNFVVPFLKYKRLKLKLRVFLAGHSLLCHENNSNEFTSDWAFFFDTMIVASIDK